MVGYIIVGFIIYRLACIVFRLDRHKGLIKSSKDPVVRRGIQTMNNAMDTWESRDGMSYPRFRLIDWFKPAKPRRYPIMSNDVRRFINR